MKRSVFRWASVFALVAVSGIATSLGPEMLGAAAEELHAEFLALREAYHEAVKTPAGGSRGLIPDYIRLGRLLAANAPAMNELLVASWAAATLKLPKHVAGKPSLAITYVARKPPFDVKIDRAKDLVVIDAKVLFLCAADQAVLQFLLACAAWQLVVPQSTARDRAQYAGDTVGDQGVADRCRRMILLANICGAQLSHRFVFDDAMLMAVYLVQQFLKREETFGSFDKESMAGEFNLAVRAMFTERFGLLESWRVARGDYGPIDPLVDALVDLCQRPVQEVPSAAPSEGIAAASVHSQCESGRGKSPGRAAQSAAAGACAVLPVN